MSKLVIDVNKKKSKIAKEVYGHFSEHLGRCIYNGIFVGKDSKIPNTDGIRNDIIDALKNIKIPVLRWPGGCFADEYHWKDGIGPLENRKKMINTHWGGVLEDNSFGTHEFMRLCELLDCEPYVNGNMGSGTVAEMSEWVEYMTFDGTSPMAELRKQNGREKPWKLKYFGVGNENWGCGGNMRPSYYADEYRRYQTYVRNYGENRIYKIACGPNAEDYNWTEELMKIVNPWYVDAISLHYYTWCNDKTACDFDVDGWYHTIVKAIKIDEIIQKHLEIMNRYDAEHRVKLIVDEWGTWHAVEKGTNPGFLYQQSTMGDAVVAALSLNIFNRYSDRISMANIAQTVNVLQSVILTEGEKMILTPTYHVFDLYKVHQEATYLETLFTTGKAGSEKFTVPKLHHSASICDCGKVNVTLCNLSESEGEEIELDLTGFNPASVSAKIVSGAMGAHNTFDSPENVVIKPFDSISCENGKVKFTVPACSVMLVEMK